MESLKHKRIVFLTVSLFISAIAILGYVTGVLPAKVLIIGSGTVAKNAAQIASGMGADVVIMGRNPDSMKSLEEILPKNISTIYSNRNNIEETTRLY